VVKQRHVDTPAPQLWLVLSKTLDTHQSLRRASVCERTAPASWTPVASRIDRQVDADANEPALVHCFFSDCPDGPPGFFVSGDADNEGAEETAGFIGQLAIKRSTGW
jgi:hypothetical protein